MPETVAFVPYDETFLALSADWLADPEIKALTMTPDFDRAAQARWFQSLPGRTDYLIWGVRHAGQPVGACGLKGIGEGAGEYWGYIGDKSCWGRGIGTEMVRFIESEARARDLNRLWLQVWQKNPRARALYERLGFRTERETGDVAVLGKMLS
jgi:RimJ/RimL family protein N-acetyltransferase